MTPMQGAISKEKFAQIAPAVHQEREGLVVSVTVVPRAPKNEIAGFRNGSLLVKVTAAPEKGKANEAVIAVIADFLDITPSNLHILRGHTSRNKMVLLQNMG